MHASLSVSVADRLRAAIMEGAFALGERLSEESLSEAMGVSRTPVREALKQLRSEGLVEIVPKSGTYIFLPTVEQVRELCECRVHLENDALQLAIRADTGALVARLTACNEAMSEALEADDLREYNRLDADFHQAFFEHCGNRYLQSAYQLIHAPVSALRAHLSARSAGALALSLHEHTELVQRVVEHDHAGAAVIIERHVARAQEHATEALTVRGAGEQRTKRQVLQEKLSLPRRPNPPA